MKNNGGYLINQIQKISSRKFNELLKEKNIDEFNGSQGVILYSLWNNKELTIKEIGKITGLAKTSLTSMLDRMEEKGLIRRKDNSEDKRSIKIMLTDKAKELEKDYNDISNKMSNIFYKNFSDKEINEIENYLERIISNLEE
ncbi:MAG: MarR family transcriptional regulator [Oscillospiraceae bacterium]|jgi:DNA-binding MarR family transcriptional regulator|nr:MarR family transcriptional regulator [Oscillospiraceae bacterium]MBR3198450.1 MarR family transcriptional regulator [Bacilli bacterium]